MQELNDAQYNFLFFFPFWYRGKVLLEHMCDAFCEILEIAATAVPVLSLLLMFASITQLYCYTAYISLEALTSTDVRWGGSPPWHSWQTVDDAIVDRKWRPRDPENDSQMNKAMGRKPSIKPSTSTLSYRWYK